MTRHDVMRDSDGGFGSPRRNHYFYSKLLDVPHLEMEQGYGRELRHLLNRTSLGAGVLCGLGVGAREGLLRVLPGVAVDAAGREIVVPEPFTVDPWRAGTGCGPEHATEPLDPDTRHEVTLCLAYHECLADWSPVHVSDCDPGPRSAPGTVVESFRAGVHEGVDDGSRGLTPEQCAGIFGPDAGAGRGPRTVVATIDVGGAPAGLAVAAGGTRALVLNDLDGAPALQVLDLAAAMVTHLLRDDRLAAPFGGASVAPEGGPVLVTHAGGIAVVDLEADDPLIVDVVLAGHPYGAGASAYGGSVAYALDPATDLVDRVDVAAAAVTDSIDTGGPVLDLAVSPPDSHWLYVAGVPGQEIVRLDTTDGTLSAVGVPGAATGTVAVRAGDDGPEAWTAFPGRIVVATETGRQQYPGPPEPRDSGFDPEGGTYHLLAADAVGEVGLTSVGAAEGELDLPAGASSLAVAGGHRVLVASPPDGTVLVTDRGRLDRHQLIAEQLSGPCPPATSDCVPIATVSLLPGGRIGTIELRRRPMLLSNAVLLDLIVCLAARVDACCGARPSARITIDPPALPPGQVGTLYPDVSVTASGGRPSYALEVLSGTVPPGLTAQSPGTGPLVLSGTPIQTGTFTFVVRATDADGVRATRGYSVPVRRQSTEAPMRIGAVEFLARHSIGAGGFETVVVGELRLGEPTVITDNGFFGIRVTFTEPVDFSTLTTAELGGGPPDAANFLVTEGGRGPLTGRLSQTIPVETTFHADLEGDLWPTGEYRVSLFGDDDGPRRAVRAAGGAQLRLDGDVPTDPTAYPPSGDGQEGGTFAFDLVISHPH